MINIRLYTGIIILIVFSFCYYFQLNNILIISLFVLTLYDIYYSKISNIKNILILFVISFILFFYSLYVFDSLYFNIVLFIFIFFLSLIKLRNSNNFFIFLIFYYFFFLFYLLTNDSHIFYLIVLLSFINDTTAYIAGNLIKGPLIIPNISPKKTWSGTLISSLFTFILFLLFGLSYFTALIISISYFFSDIYFSYFKRINNLKDFSNLLPGHGGILDRLDSIFIPTFITIILIL